MKNSNTGMVLAPNPADIISRQLKLDRNTFLQAVNLYNSLTQLDQSATVAAPNEGGEEDTGKRGPGRPKGSKNRKPGRPKAKRGPGRPKKKRGPGRPKAKKGPGRPKAKRGPGRPKAKKGPGRPAAKRGPGRPKAKKGPGRPAAKRGPGRPKGSVAKRKTVKGGATASRRGRKAKNPNGMTMRDAVTNALRNANGPVKAPAIAETLKGQGFTSKSLNTQVAQELSRMVTDGLASRPERGSYAWSGSNAPAEQTAEVAQTA